MHGIALALILTAGGFLISKSISGLEPKLVLAVVIYLLCSLASNLASAAYHLPLGITGANYCDALITLQSIPAFLALSHPFSCWQAPRGR